MTEMLHRPRLVFLVIGAGLAIAGGLAYATIPDANGVIHGCYDAKDGMLRVIDAPTDVCTSKEVALAWNQTGPQGPPGVGASDGFATFLEIGDPAVPIALANAQATPVGQLNLPAGSYIVTASLFITNSGPGNGIGYCLLLMGGRNAQVIDTIPEGSAASQALTVAATLAAPATANLQCTNNTLVGGSLSVETFNLNAVKLGTLTFQ